MKLLETGIIGSYAMCSICMQSQNFRIVGKIDSYVVLKVNYFKKKKHMLN